MRVYRGEHQKLKLANSNNFLDDVKVNVEAVVYPEDKQSFADHINHEPLRLV